MQKESRRIRMTKMLLNESLLKFMAQKPLARITVKEICGDADMNRSTYYAHFQDPYDQLKKLEASVLADMVEYASDIAGRDFHDAEWRIVFIKGILEYIKLKKSVFTTLLSERVNIDFQQEFMIYLGEQLHLGRLTDDASMVQEDYEFIFAATGCFGVIHQWLLSDMKVDVERVAVMMDSFVSRFRS